MEPYSRQHKDAISKKVPSTYVQVFPLKSQPKQEKKPESTLTGLPAPQHFQLSTPPLDQTGLERPLQALEFPLPDFRPPTRRLPLIHT